MKITNENIDLIEDIEWGDLGDYKGCDAFIQSASWKNGIELSDEELDDLNGNWLSYFDESRLDGYISSQYDLAEYYRENR